ncbi:MAG: metallophosphoesterase family protein [Pseudomonadota bacterium]
MAILGIISDTHGLLRPEATAFLTGCDLIVHAGDIGKPEIIEGLETIAPVRAIRGNVDRAAWARNFPDTDTVRFAEKRIYLIHDVHDLPIDPEAMEYDVVISGHSHRPSEETKGSVLYFNPGSAGPRRFSLPITLARFRIEDGAISIERHDITG